MDAYWEPSRIRHPIQHYRATDVDAEKGVRRVRSLFETAGIEYAVVPAAERLGADADAAGDSTTASEPPLYR